eukprot:scaffold19666_cov26-Tisochrysis_lutea.AAC.1
MGASSAPSSIADTPSGWACRKLAATVVAATIGYRLLPPLLRASDTTGGPSSAATSRETPSASL